MKKKYLLSYNSPKFLVVSDYIDYELNMKIVWFWGLFSTMSKLTYRVYDYQDLNSFFKHWDKLIKDKTPF